MPQPYDYTIRPTGQSPIRTASGLIGLQGAVQQQQQQQAEQQRQAQFRMGLQQLDPNDPAAVQALAQQYPGQIEQIEGFQGFANEQQQMQVRDAVGGMITAAQSGDPELLQQTIDQYAPVISGTGDPSITPEVLKRIARNKPEAFMKMMQGSYGRAGGDLEALGIAKPLTTYQQAELDIKQSKNLVDQGNLKIRETEARIKQEDNDLKREKLINELEQQEIKLEKDRKTLADGEKVKASKLTQVADAYKLATKLAGDENLSRITGTATGVEYEPTFRPASADLINEANTLQNLLTVDNLDLFTGVLTQSDIDFLKSISTGLNITDKGIIGSEGAVRKRFEEISKRLKTALENKNYDFSQLETPEGDEIGSPVIQSEQAQQYSDGTKIRNPKTGEILIMSGGKWVQQ